MCERELEIEQRLQHIDLPSPSGHRRVSFSFSWSAQPGAWGPSFSGTCSHSSIFSPTGLVFKLTDFLYSPSCIIVQSPTQYLPILPIGLSHFHCPWNGMFDCHRAEITVMQFTGHSLPVHQSMTVPWDFNPVPYCQPDSLTLMEYALPPSLEWHVWPGRRSIYNSLFNDKVSHFLARFICFLVTNDNNHK